MSLMGKKLPGAAEWYGEYLGVSNCGDYDNNNGGLLKFPDGTIWRWEVELGSWITDALVNQALEFIEYRPGSKYWEHLSADWRIEHWSDFSIDPNTLPSGGDMRVSSFGYSTTYFLGHADDDDLVYAFDVWDEYGYRLLMFDKNTYQWTNHRDDMLAAETAAGKYLYPVSVPTFDQDYGYYLSEPDDLVVIRFRRGDPSDMQVIHTWTGNTAVWERSLNPSTGRIHALDEDYLGNFNWPSYGNAHMVYHNGVFIITHYAAQNADGLDNTAEYSWFSIREWDGVSDQTKLLYWGHAPDGYSLGATYGANGDRSEWIDVDAGLGAVLFRPVGSSEMRVRDGWLYWHDDAGIRSSQSTYFARINLDELRAQYALSGPVQHELLNPRFEILCNASAPWESDAAWKENVGWQVLWREGDSPIYNTIDKNWFFDDDGAIVFAHEEFPNWAINFDEYTHWVISRLVPPEANNANLSLVFEGQALKGYSGVRDAGSAWAPEEIVLR